MAIISASRKTDIPTYFSEWFLNRMEAGEFFVRNNPYNPHAVTHLTFAKEDIDCIVFWTKNPLPMMSKLDRLNSLGYNYYFQYTITNYGAQLEAGLPPKEKLRRAFIELSEKTNGRVVWRYDPIVIDDNYTFADHLNGFKKIATELKGYTDRCVISFVDLYQFVEKSLTDLGINTLDVEGTRTKYARHFTDFCKSVSEIAGENGMKVFTCAEDIVLSNVGIERGSCIDKDLIEKIVGYKIKAGKDKGQRSACLCAESVDIGKYDTCKNGCRYCYACRNKGDVDKNFAAYDPNSIMLCDKLTGEDVITEKRLQSLRVVEDTQLTLF